MIDNDVISVDDDEEINLVNDESTPCTMLVAKMLNFIQHCFSSKLSPFKAISKEQMKTSKQSADEKGGTLILL